MQLIDERRNILDLIAKKDAGEILKHTFNVRNETPVFQAELNQLQTVIVSALNQYKTAIVQKAKSKMQEILA